MRAADQEIIPLAAIDAVRQPITKAKGLLNVAYTDPALFEFERDNVFAKTWVRVFLGYGTI